MLTLTENATTIINSITHQPEAPAGTALRITSDQAGEGLAVTTTTEPGEGDQVVEQAGATVYLDPEAAVQLDDKVLDAQLTQDGGVEFGLGQQA